MTNCLDSYNIIFLRFFGQTGLSKHCRPVRSGSTLFAILSALFGHITVHHIHIVQFFRVITAMFSAVRIFKTFMVCRLTGQQYLQQFLYTLIKRLLPGPEKWLSSHSYLPGEFNFCRRPTSFAYCNYTSTYFCIKISQTPAWPPRAWKHAMAFWA